MYLGRLYPGNPDYEADYRVLKSFGCSKLAIDCYRSLYEEGSATAGDLARRLGKNSRNGLYEVLSSLRLCKLIKSYRYDGWTIHEYIPLNQALVARHREERLTLSELIEYQQLRATSHALYV